MKRHLHESAAGALLIGGLLFAVLSGFALVHATGRCHDVTAASTVFARTSAGATMPIPIVQGCERPLYLFVLYYAGYLVSLIGTIALLKARPTKIFTAGVTIAAICVAAAMPFFPNTDPYAYALYAYQTFVLHVSPYAVAHLQNTGPVSSALSALFPAGHNLLRTSAYGPVFAALYALAVGPFGRISLLAMIVAERLLGAALLVVLGIAVSRSVEEQQRRRAFIAVVLNPLLLFESVSFCHGDVVMLAVLAAAYLAFRKNRLTVSAVLCVLAVEVRFVALVAPAVLACELLRRRQYRELLHATAIAGAVFAATAVLSNAAFGQFRLAGGFFSNNYDAPATIAATILMPDPARAFSIGAMVQIAIGASAFFIALKERAYALVPVAVLAALPVYEPWYGQWLVAPAAVSGHLPYVGATLAVVALAPLRTMPDVVFLHAPVAVHVCFTLLLWTVPLAVYAVLARKTAAGILQHA